MNSNKKVLFKIFLHPRERFYDLWVRLFLTILSIALIIIIPSLIINKYVRGELILIASIIHLLAAVTIILLLAHDYFTRFRRISEAYKAYAKVYITYTDVSIKVRNNEIKKMRWEEIDIIEKGYYYNDKVILLITDIMGGSYVKCSYKLNNYIMLPYRDKIETAIVHFSKRKVELAPNNIDRFGRND